MAISQSNLIQSTEDLTTAWLSSIVGHQVARFSTHRIGTGQVSEAYRVQLSYEANQGPETLVLKVAAQDPTSRSSAKSLNLYQREVDFYTKCAPSIPDVTAKCWHASFDKASDSFCLLLEDARPAAEIDDIRGVPLDQALVALEGLGRLHAIMCSKRDEPGFSWISRDSQINQASLSQLFLAYRARYRNRLPPKHMAVCERVIASFDSYDQISKEDSSIIRGPLHGDYRVDNLLFGLEGSPRPLTVVDWQTVTYGSLAGEFGYFLGSIDTEIRRQNFNTLLAAYHGGLNSVDGIEIPLSLDQIKEQLRKQAFFGVVMGIASPMLVVQTERGDDMFMTTMARHCDLALDLGAVDTLPRAKKPLDAPLVPRPEDERTHEREKTNDELWNESYYFDFIDPEQSVAGWIRLGLTPNLKVNNFSTMVSRKGEALVSFTDYEAPSPTTGAAADDSTESTKDTERATLLRLQTADYLAEFEVSEPLKSFRLEVTTNSASVFSDETAPLRASAQPVSDTPLSLALIWQTDGAPYQYRITTRYEIPCTVSGTICIGDQKLKLTQVPGQRDHSWGVRDWWSMSWMWSTIHIPPPSESAEEAAASWTSSSHIHALDLRIPGRPSMGMGYSQSPNSIHELEEVESKWQIAGNGTCDKATMNLVPQGAKQVSVVIEPQGHAPTRLVETGGQQRVSLFDRAWCRCTFEDGRVGWGWFEWNRPIGLEP